MGLDRPPLDAEIASMGAAIRTAESKVLEALGFAKAEIDRKNGEAATQTRP